MVNGIGKSNVNQPAVIAAFNQGMCGVELLDHVLSDLRLLIWGKESYWPLVINALNTAFVYRWQVFRIISEKIVGKLFEFWYNMLILRS